jgi:lactate dehydrogenase-like 2-hydroxyacid dehydrogenase
MKKSAYLINTARGDIVVESDLVKALKDDVIKGAGLDVYQKEPEVHEGLLKLKNVFLLPHLGSATEETREAMGMRVLNNIQAFFNGDEPNDRVV